jgi:hypothetical protein
MVCATPFFGYSVLTIQEIDFMRLKRAGLGIVLFAFSTFALAQKNEISLGVGAVVTGDQQTSFEIACSAPLITCPPGFTLNTSTATGVGLEGSYTRRLFDFGRVSLGAEFPVLGIPSRDLTTTLSGVHAATSISSVFFTPSAQIRFRASSGVSPFLSVGGGLAHHEAGSAVNRWALQFGGGLDFKTPLPHLGIRAEVRDFWARAFNGSSGAVHVSPEHLHNVFAGAGVVFKF